MLTSPELQDLASATSVLRRRIEREIVAAPSSPATMMAFLRLTEGERAAQRDFTAASAHLAQASALLLRLADCPAPAAELMTL